MSRIYTTIMLLMLATAIAAGSALAQQAYSGTAPAMGAVAGPTTSFALGGDTSYHITPISLADGWRAEWLGITRAMVPSGSTAYVIHSDQPLDKISNSTGAANTIVFGPNGYAGAIPWDGQSGGFQKFAFTGSNGQFYMITQLSGGAKDHVVVSFE